GEKGWVVVERDALGRSVFPKGLDYFAPSRGNDLVLTIDEVIQHVVESEMDAVMEQTRAAGGFAIVMDPRTGEVLALVVRPGFNPNRIEWQDPEQWRNRAVTDLYEPGSTLKIVTAAAALQEGAAGPADIFYCEEGRMVLAGGTIRDHKKEGYLTFSEVIQKSSNIGTVKIAMRLGDKPLYRYLRAFGFGEKTGIDIVGESPGMLKEPRAWSGRSLASIAIGHEIAATPIQVIAAVSAIANGGWLVRPRLVSEIRNPDGRVATAFLPEIRRQAVSLETAKQMMSILEGTVSKDGTGEKAAIPGYRVAGKTGTSQKIDPVTKRYSMRETVSSFVGIVPAEDPRIVVLVVVDTPSGDSWGGSVAAPVFKRIAEPVLRYLGVPPRTQERIVVASAG
ncbi:MAG TPA: penicillin-binding protein 2, partial [Nitrospiria bacterium]